MPLWREAELESAAISTDVHAGLFFLAEHSGTPAGTVKFQLDDPLFGPTPAPKKQPTFIAWPCAEPMRAQVYPRRFYVGP